MTDQPSTDDLPTRLRAQVAYDELLPDYSNMTDDERLFHEAADRITELESANSLHRETEWFLNTRIERLESTVSGLREQVARMSRP